MSTIIDSTITKFIMLQKSKEIMLQVSYRYSIYYSMNRVYPKIQ